MLSVVVVNYVFKGHLHWLVKETYLPSESNLFAILKSRGTSSPVGVVEHDRHARFHNASLTTLVDQVLLILSSHLTATEQLKHEWARI